MTRRPLETSAPSPVTRKRQASGFTSNRYPSAVVKRLGADAFIGWRIREIIRETASKRLADALKDGSIVKPARCGRCGVKAGPPGAKNRKTTLQGHHHDYCFPLQVMWLCCSCHRLEHVALDAATKEVR